MPTNQTLSILACQLGSFSTVESVEIVRVLFCILLMQGLVQEEGATEGRIDGMEGWRDGRELRGSHNDAQGCMWDFVKLRGLPAPAPISSQ